MMFDSYDFDPNVPNGFQKIGLRFQDVFIPAGALIDSAHIQFRSDETDNVFAEFLLFAEDTENAAPFDNGDLLSVSARNTFIDSVYWAPPAWTGTGLTGPAQKTSDVSELLQQIIDRDGWSPGNDIVFIVEGTGVSLTDEDAIRVADSYEGKPEYPPTLVFYYYFDAGLVGMNFEEAVSSSYIYPNPFYNTLHINIPSTGNQPVTVQINDISGKIVYAETLPVMNNKLTLNPGIQNKGAYLVRVLSISNEEILKQIIIKY
jgi:hypothetical protein